MQILNFIYDFLLVLCTGNGIMNMMIARTVKTSKQAHSKIIL